jgi:hypothetical protein
MYHTDCRDDRCCPPFPTEEELGRCFPKSAW